MLTSKFLAGLFPWCLHFCSWFNPLPATHLYLGPAQPQIIKKQLHWLNVYCSKLITIKQKSINNAEIWKQRFIPPLCKHLAKMCQNKVVMQIDKFSPCFKHTTKLKAHSFQHFLHERIFLCFACVSYNWWLSCALLPLPIQSLLLLRLLHTDQMGWTVLFIRPFPIYLMCSDAYACQHGACKQPS